jgi:hypothetical protein
MASKRDRTRTADKPETTRQQEERDIRRMAHSTGQERADMPLEPEENDKNKPERRAPDAMHTRDPKPFPTQRHKSGPGRKF